MSTKLPKIVRYRPYFYKPITGKTYHWCACGLSRSQPFCDGSHRDTSFTPIPFKAETEPRDRLFCACKRTNTPPFCDGTHNNLLDRYAEDDPNSEKNRDIPEVQMDAEGYLRLNGDCQVARPHHLTAQQTDNLRLHQVIHGHLQSQVFLQVHTGLSPALTLSRGHGVALASQGQGRLLIGDRAFDLSPHSGFYIRPNESFQIENTEAGSIHLYLSYAPAKAQLQITQTTSKFDRDYPDRQVAINSQQRQRMGDRFFQILVDSHIGADLMTQFIGHIPQSKAQPHRHLYEESLIVLSGSGYLWTEDLKAKVMAGDAIFLPAQQIHSLQCTDPKGMVVAGVICPGGNPNINY